MDDQLDEEIKRLIAAGATDDDILFYVKNRKSSAPVSTPAPTVEKTGFLEGAKQGMAHGLDALAESFGGKKEKNEKFFSKVMGKPATIEPFADPNVSISGTSGKVGEFAGYILPGVITAIGSSGALNPLTAGIGSKMMTPLAEKASSFVASKALKKAVEVGIKTIPQEMIAGTVIEGMINPEAFEEPQSFLRAAVFSSLGSVINGGLAYKGVIKKIKTSEGIEAVRKQINEVFPYELPPQNPLAPQVDPLAGTLPSQLDIGLSRNIVAQDPNLLPDSHGVARRNVRDILERELAERQASLQNGPKVAEKKSLLVERKPDLDPIEKAAVRGMRDRLSEANNAKIQLETATLGSGDSRSASNIGIDSPLPANNIYGDRLTFEELESYHDILSGFKRSGKIQSRIDAKAKKGWQNMSLVDIHEVQVDMVRMADEILNGFDLPRPPRTWLSVETKDTPHVYGSDIPTSAKLENPQSFIHEIDPTSKRWVTSADESLPLETREVLAKDYEASVSNANIDYASTRKSSMELVWDRMKNWKQEFIDRTFPVGKLNQHSQDLMHSLSGVSQHSDEFLKNQMRRYILEDDGTWKGKTEVVPARPLQKIVDDFSPDEIKELDAHLKSLNTLDNPDYNSGMDPKAAKDNVELAPQKIKDAAKEFNIVTNTLIDNAVTLGRISEETAKEWKSRFYAPNGRSFNQSTSFNPFRGRSGSDRMSRSPVASMFDVAHKLMEQTHKNNAWAKLIDDYWTNPKKYEGIIEPSSTKAREVFQDRIKALKADGAISEKAAIELASMEDGFDITNGSLLVFREGRPEYYKVNDELRRTVEALNPVEFGLLKSLLTLVSRPVREGVSVALDLSGVGPISDALIGSMTVPNFNPIVDPIRGAWHAATKSGKYQERIAALGAFGGRLIPGETQVFKSEGASKTYKAARTLSRPFEFFREKVRPISDATRMGIYLARTEAGDTPLQAALTARRSIGDWNRMGASMRSWALITEFGNVGIQSLKASQELLTNAAKDPKLALKAITTGVVGITLPTIYFRNEALKDPELNAYRLSDQGYRYWWTRTDEGEIVKFPKPGFHFGQIFGSSIEAALDGMNPEDAKRLTDGFTSQVGMNMFPLSAQTAIGLATNTRNPLDIVQKKIPIVPRSQQGVEAIAQGGPETTPLGRMLVNNVGISPYKADYTVDRVTGGLYSSIIRAVSGGREGGSQKSDIPIYGRFFPNDKTSTQGSSLFYRDIEKARTIDDTFKRLVSQNRAEEAEVFVRGNETFLAARKHLEGTAKEIAKIQAMIFQIGNDPAMSKEGKRKVINELRTNLNEVFSSYVEVHESLK